MVKYIASVLIFAFVIASSGLHKLAFYQEQTEVAVMEVYENVSGEVICCNHDEESSESSTPRCLGDNCITYLVLPAFSVGVGQRLHTQPISFAGKFVEHGFLRPPIA